MRTTHLAALTGALLAFCAFAQPLPSGVTKGPSIEGISEYSFPNGLRVLLYPDASNPKVTVNVTYLVGSRHEGYGETGMAHLLEHLLFMQTSTGRDIKKELTSHGASWNGSTWYDRTNYFETVTASDENLRWALALEADRMIHSRVEKSFLDTEMTVVRNEFERGENSPQRVLQERVLATAYLWHNYGKSTIGSRSDIERVPIDNLAAFYRKFYQPDNALLVVAGQMDVPKTLAMISDTFGKIPKPTRKLDETYTQEPVQDGERYVSLKRVGDGKAIIMAYHTPAAAHADSAALEVLAAIMSGGGGFRGGMATGRLYKAIVENKRAVSANMSSQQLHDAGFATLSAQLSNEQSLPEARTILIDTIEGVVKEPPTKEEVDRAKTRLLRAAENRMTNSQALGLELSEWSAMGDWRLVFLTRDRIKNVTPEDVVRVAKTYFVESNRTVGEFIPTDKPVRAEIPVAPTFATLFKDYKGGEAVSEGEAFDPTPANIESRLVRKSLSNGVKLVVLPRKTRGAVVNAVLELHFGDEKSLAGQSAVAQLTGGLLMRGTKTKTRQQLQDEMDRIKSRILVTGGGGAAAAGPRRGPAPAAGSVSDVVASIESTAENLPAALKLAVEMLREPALSDNDLEQIKQQRIAMIESMRSEPSALAPLELQRRMSPFGKNDPRYLGTIDEQLAELKKVTIDDVRRFHAKFYGAANGELAVLGPVDAATVQKSAEGLLASWKSTVPYTRLATPYKKTEAAKLDIKTPYKENAQFEAGVRLAISQDHPDYPALLLANYMFGGNLGSRMPNRIRNKEGLSYSVRSSFTAPAFGDGALFSALAISAPQNAAKVQASFLDELSNTLKFGFTATEVAGAQKAWLEMQQVARAQEAALVRLLADRERAGRTMKWDEKLEASIRSLTPEQINAAFRRHVDPAALAIIKAGDFK